MADSVQASKRSRLVQVFGVIWPGVAVAAASPFIAGAAMMPNAEGLFLVVPPAAGALAVPGYLYALLGWRSIPGLPLGVRWWVRASFAVVLVAAAVGAVFSLVLLVPSIASMLTIINGVVAWSRLEDRSVEATAGNSA